jgi:hypothetical protein
MLSYAVQTHSASPHILRSGIVNLSISGRVTLLLFQPNKGFVNQASPIAYRSIRTNLPVFAARLTASITLRFIKPSRPETSGFSLPWMTLQNCRI